MLCRQEGPPGSVRMEPIELTSCAWQADVTRSLLRSNVTSREPTTTASATVYASSLSRGATVQSSGIPVALSRFRYQTFHSSNEMLIRLLVDSFAATWSAVDTTSWMKPSMLTDEARKLARSSSSSSSA